MQQALSKYREKRRFDRSPEPRGTATRRRGPLRFVVQKHAARRLHYDFRLEMDGVLKSWAVPKGPSLNPKDKRLALMVEDHPWDYRSFEGIIPEGNYGAGTVMVWDEGTYEPREAGTRAHNEKLLLEELAHGRLHFILHGAKLQGEFALVRTGRDGGNQWLLIKHRDAYATDADVLDEDRSALTRRTMAQVAADSVNDGAVWSSDPKHNTADPKRATPARRRRGKNAGSAPMPHRVKPMLATLVAGPFDRNGWYFEVKWDGFRAIAEVEDGKVRLYSRTQLSYEDRFPTIVRTLAGLKHDAVLDGEIVVLDPQGRATFQLLQKYQQTGRGTLAYVVFDLLYLDGEDLRSQPLRRRKQLLSHILPGKSSVMLSEHLEEQGIEFFRAASRLGLEGIMAKKADSLYHEGKRSRDWLKIKSRQQQDVVIGGFTEPRGTRQAFGALVVGVFEGTKLAYAGHVGGGFDNRTLADVYRRLEPLIQSTCPFSNKPKTNAPVRWVKPALVCEVAFQEWTQDGQMRQPIFLGLREDKPAAAVKRERPSAAPR